MFVTSDGTAFRPLRTGEAQYESIVLNLIPTVFVGWNAYRWKKRVFTPEGRGAEPDLMLLSKTSYDWTVVEVELGRHSISGHVADQLDRLARSRYDSSLRDSFVAAGVGGDEALQYLRRRPSLLCIADEGSTRLADCCQAHGFDFAVLQPFCDQLARPALHVQSLPGQYRTGVETSLQYYFKRAVDALFGRWPLVVPDDFPSVETFLLRDGGIDTVTPVVDFGHGRIVFLPSNSEGGPSDQGVRMGIIDLDRAVFEIVRD